MAQRPNPFRAAMASLITINPHPVQAVKASLKRLVKPPLDLHATLTIKTGDEVSSLALGQWDGQDIIMSGCDHTAQVWDAAGNVVGLPIPNDPGYEVFSVALRRLGDQDFIMSHGFNGLQRWNPSGDPVGPVITDANFPLATGRLEGQDVIIAFSRTGDGDVAIWDAEGRLIRPLFSEPPVITALAIGRLNDQDVIVFGDPDGNIHMADASGRRIGRPLTIHTGEISSLVITKLAGQDTIVSGSWDCTVRLWDADGQPIHPLTGYWDRVKSVAVGTLNGREIIAAAGEDGVGIWDTEGEHLGTITRTEAAAVAIGQFAGRDVIVTGHETEVRIWGADSPGA